MAIAVPQINLERLAVFLKKIFPVQVETRGSILKLSKKDTAEKIASCRIFNPRKPYEKHIPSREEILFEEANFEDTAKTENTIMYDGFEIQKTLTDLIPNHERTSDSFHIFFTNKLTCTYDSNDYRYHGRALIGANPSIISTTGIIEAPAKPRRVLSRTHIKFYSGHKCGINKTKIQRNVSYVTPKWLVWADGSREHTAMAGTAQLKDIDMSDARRQRRVRYLSGTGTQHKRAPYPSRQERCHVHRAGFWHGKPEVPQGPPEGTARQPGIRMIVATSRPDHP